MFKQLMPEEAKSVIDSKSDVILLDVREQNEFDFNRIEGARLYPLSQISSWVNELKKECEYIVYCHHGMRSQKVCSIMTQNGFQSVNNLQGGIDAWSRFIDSSVPLY